MKRTLCLAAALLAMPLAPARAQPADPAEMADARAIIATMFPAERQDEIFRRMMEDMMAQMRAGFEIDQSLNDPGLRKIIDEYLDGTPERVMPTLRIYMPGILEATAEAYSREFAPKELQEIRAFAETPAGKHYFSSVTSLLSDPAVAAANQRYFAAVEELLSDDKEKLKAKLVAYLSDHPEVLAKIKPQD